MMSLSSWDLNHWISISYLDRPSVKQSATSPRPNPARCCLFRSVLRRRLPPPLLVPGYHPPPRLHRPSSVWQGASPTLIADNLKQQTYATVSSAGLVTERAVNPNTRGQGALHALGTRNATVSSAGLVTERAVNPNTRGRGALHALGTLPRVPCMRVRRRMGSLTMKISCSSRRGDGCERGGGRGGAWRGWWEELSHGGYAKVLLQSCYNWDTSSFLLTSCCSSPTASAQLQPSPRALLLCLLYCDQFVLPAPTLLLPTATLLLPSGTLAPSHRVASQHLWSDKIFPPIYRFSILQTCFGRRATSLEDSTILYKQLNCSRTSCLFGNYWGMFTHPLLPLYISYHEHIPLRDDIMHLFLVSILWVITLRIFWMSIFLWIESIYWWKGKVCWFSTILIWLFRYSLSSKVLINPCN
jgi:hypothetical protein